MKKKFTLLVTLLLALSVLLTACGNNAKETKSTVRWNEESYTYHVSLADFEYGVETDAETKVYKEKSMTGEVFSSLDEITPFAVDGTFSMQLTKAGDVWTVTTQQTLYVMYLDVQVGGRLISEIEELKGLIVEDYASVAPSLVEAASKKETTSEGEALSENDASSENEVSKIVLKSTTSTSVSFKNETQRPKESHSEVDGFYLGQAHQQATSYELKTVYDYSGKRPMANVYRDGSETATQYKLANNITVYDSNQLLLYVRGLEKTQSNVQDNPSAQFFYPVTGETVTANFTDFKYESPSVITDKNRDPEEKTVNLNRVCVALGGMAYMAQENIPDYVSGNIDKTKGDTYKYTTVHFRVGYLSYELAQYTESQWENLGKETETAA